MEPEHPTLRSRCSRDFRVAKLLLRVLKIAAEPPLLRELTL